MNTLTIHHEHEAAEPALSTFPRKAWTSVKLFALWLFWHYGLTILFFAGFCLACYLYLDTVMAYLLSPDLNEQVKHTPTAGKVVVVVVAGRRVAVRMNRRVKVWKAKYIKGE